MKKFNWKEFGLYCGIGALIGLITSLIEVIVKTLLRKRDIRKAEAEERQKQHEEYMEILKNQNEELDELREKLNASRSKVLAERDKNHEATEKLREINHKLEKETDINKIAELQEEQRKVIAGLARRLENL